MKIGKGIRKTVLLLLAGVLLAASSPAALASALEGLYPSPYAKEYERDSKNLRNVMYYGDWSFYGEAENFSPDKSPQQN